ncbi:MAG TPA: NAD(P)H-quinone oxidoreductase [Kofleriaceae bacterium]|nr:NAD(P)H-quinone oxidoreductase [Kofleriaceae bacterium]
MRVPAIVFRGSGGPEVIAIGETDVRDPGFGEVSVEIAAAGVNRADVLQRKGMYPPPPGASDVPGLELAGTVVARGAGASFWSEGARVMAITAGGGLAKRITLHERELVAVPASIDLIDAGGIPEVFWTAWDALVLQAGLRAGETVVVHAASSGVGTAALQIARAIGARAIATARTRSKLESLVAMDLVTDTIAVTDGGFAKQVHALTAGRGADVVLDLVGASYFEEDVRAIATRGRIVLLSTAGGASGNAPFGMMLGKRATVIGTVLRARPLEEKIALAREIAAHVTPLFERGALRPVIDRVMPMHDCAAAHAHMEANANVGKIVLSW